ncbi:hypothetical protein BDW62DRAFT_187111 [Aspergillus aurantiobrunneus]
MEGCPVSEPPPGAGLTTYIVFLVSILTPILVILCVFLSIIDTRISILTRTSVSGHTNSDWSR